MKIVFQYFVLFFVFIISLTIILVSPVRVYAASDTQMQNSTGQNTAAGAGGGGDLYKFFNAINEAQKNGTVNSTTWTAGVPGQSGYLGAVGNIAGGLLLMTGFSPNLADNTSGADAGAIGALAYMIAAPYNNPPASSVQYFADLGSRIGIGGQPAYAQVGTAGGFNKFIGFIEVWKTFRDVAYAILAIVFVLVGLAIMFRLKINPQTVISIQNAIPRLIIVLILITFSYAIAGFLVDLMFVFSGLSVAIINPTGIFDRAAAGGGFLSFTTTFFYHGFIFAGQVSDLFNPGMMTVKGLGVTDPVSTTVLRFFTQIIPGAGGISVLVSLILCIMVLFAFFKVLLILLKAYIGVIIKIILAPLQILLGAFPGSSAGFGSWLKGMVSDLAVFPAVLVMLMLGSKIAEFAGNSGNDGIWRPPLLGIDNNTLGGMIGFGFLLMTPKAAEMVKSAFAGKPFEYGSAIGEAVGAPFRALTGAIGTGVGLAGMADKTYSAYRNVYQPIKSKLSPPPPPPTSPRVFSPTVYTPGVRPSGSSPSWKVRRGGR